MPYHRLRPCLALLGILLLLMLSVAASFTMRNRVWSRLGRKSLSAVATSAAIDQLAVSHPAYEKEEDFFIKEYGLKGAMYVHKKSGAQVVSVLSPSDNNKVFGITFRTPPADSTGVPHILEHSVLCGSRKFPVKEPFVDLLKGSLQNFLNAFTYADRTCYPVASTNTKDFYNLIHVYLDAVLHPNAVNNPQILQQEGWHYELDELNQPLSIKGVVYNEMKGVYSSPDALMDRAAQLALFPDNTYGVDSGGDPLDIPTLTFEQFRSFHQNYYHPSNSRVFFYGDDDPLQRLVLLDEYLKDFDRIPVTSQVKYQPKKSKPQKISIPYPVAQGTEPKHMVSVNWLMNDQQLANEEILALGVLDYLLLGTSTSSLKKVLTESNLGESVLGGLSDELLQATFSAGLKGVKKENVEQIEELVHSTLRRLAETGFEADAIEAAMNTLEFRLREFNTGGYPRGLSIMLGMMQHWIYDKPPVDGIQFEKPLQALKEKLQRGEPVFQTLIKKYLTANDHRITVEMVPDADLEAKTAEEENKKLEAIKAGMTEDELKEIIETTKLLREAQEREDSPEAKATIPALTIEDIDPKISEIPMEIIKDSLKGDEATIVAHPQETSGILYTQIAFDYSSVNIEDVELLPLFTRMLMEAGTKNYDETTLARRIGANTGGISVSYFNDLKHEHGKVNNPDEALLYLTIGGKAVASKVPLLFDLFKEILLEAKLDNQKRAVEMLREIKVRKESSVVTSGHSYTASRISARHSLLGYLSEVTGGLHSVRRAGKLLEQAEQDWPSIQARLEKIRDTVIRNTHAKDARKLLVNLTGNKELLASSIDTVHQFIKDIPSAQAPSQSIVDTWKKEKAQRALPVRNEGFAIPSLVNYVGLGGQIFQPKETVEGSTAVISRYLSTGYMWNQIRVLGGAYGGFVRFSEQTGRFLFLSYRDPNLFNTLQVYKGAADFLSEEEVSSEELLQAIIGTVGELDSPLSADQKGSVSFVRFLTDETSESRQKYRDAILHTSQKDFKEFAERLKTLRESGSVVVFGSQQALDKANAELAEQDKLIVENAF